jgi:hypothetical protein
MAYSANFGDTGNIFPFPRAKERSFICYANLTYSQLFIVCGFGMSTALPRVSEDTVIRDERTPASQALLSIDDEDTDRQSLSLHDTED